jgi:hypothetical protein
MQSNGLFGESLPSLPIRFRREYVDLQRGPMVGTIMPVSMDQFWRLSLHRSTSIIFHGTRRSWKSLVSSSLLGDSPSLVLEPKDEKRRSACIEANCSVFSLYVGDACRVV